MLRWGYENYEPSTNLLTNLRFNFKAVIMEVMRCANIIPTGVQHMSYKDFTVNGVTIPANSLINPLMTNILKGDHWKEGTRFNPDRFLDSDGHVKNCLLYTSPSPRDS